MVTKRMLEALNGQINAELYSSYIYLSMSAYFEDSGLTGFAHWMRLQAQEEVEHAMRIFDYLIDRGKRVDLDVVEKPPHTWGSPLDAFQAAYEHEQKVTSMIDNLVDLAIKDNDHATNNMLQWFVDEQVEEEASASEIVDRLTLIGDNTGALLMLDRELGERSPDEE